MKSLILYTSILFQLACGATDAQENKQQANQSDPAKPELKEVRQYKVHPLTGEKTLESTSYYKNNLPVKVLTNRGSFTQKALYEYNEDGNVTKYTSFNQNDEPDYVVNSVYDGKNKVKETTPYGKTTFKYDSHGQLIEKQEFDKADALNKAEKIEIKYEANHPVHKLKYVSRNGGEFELQGEQILKYNDNGELIHEISRTPYSHYEYDYSYHSNGEIKEKITIAFDGTEKVVELFNQAGKRNSESIYRRKSQSEEFQLDQKNTWTYDRQGNLAGFEITRGGEVTKKEVYENIY